jgi:hypothetical protein
LDRPYFSRPTTSWSPDPASTETGGLAESWLP